MAGDAEDVDGMEGISRFCADALSGGMDEAIADRAGAYVSKELWPQLVDEQKRAGGCEDLARAARELLRLRQGGFCAGGGRPWGRGSAGFGACPGGLR
ncbi:hypothetical protein [Mangrovactinospora gilvigrisea]|uniref:hypothetical protein n=1 Tax=Mangrovactinospora gilvigrisea TaxID=1428644 RepID=UPI000B125C8F|nr:hypothetical protein [Mangrovactinospora gilvigrisea]